MTLYYLDTSAWIKRYVIEGGSERIEEVFAKRVDRASSTLGFIEAHAALARRNRQAADAGSFHESLQDIAADWEDFLRIRLTDAVAEQARRQAVALGLKAADAVHLASALALARRKPRTYDRFVMAASDRELLAAAGEAGLETWNPEDGA